MEMSSASSVNSNIMVSGISSAAAAKAAAMGMEKRMAMPSTTWMARMSPLP